jgi:hypothetical protein
MSPIWPPPGNELPPEGHYSLKLNREPDIKKEKTEAGKEYVRLVLYATALGTDGNYRIVDGFVPWDPRYADLCKALGVEHGKDITMEGAVFEADIKHEEFKGKVRARIANIVVQADIPDKSVGDDIPF